MIDLLETIETLEYAKRVIGDENETINKPIDKTIQALRQALAQPEQKPVAWMHELADGHRHCITKDESGYVDNFTDTYKTIPLYTAPPKREWMGLTDDEIKSIWDYTPSFGQYFAKAIEAKLKEKNGG